MPGLNRFFFLCTFDFYKGFSLRYLFVFAQNTALHLWQGNSSLNRFKISFIAFWGLCHVMRIIHTRRTQFFVFPFYAKQCERKAKAERTHLFVSWYLIFDGFWSAIYLKRRLFKASFLRVIFHVFLLYFLYFFEPRSLQFGKLIISISQVFFVPVVAKVIKRPSQGFELVKHVF